MPDPHKNSPVVLIMLPHFKGIGGHLYTYFRAVGRATEILGWEHHVYLPLKHNISRIPEDIPENWHFALDQGVTIKNDLANKVIRRLQSFSTALFKLSSTVRQVLSHHLSESERPLIVITDDYWVSRIAGVLVASLQSSDRIHVWCIERLGIMPWKYWLTAKWWQQPFRIYTEILMGKMYQRLRNASRFQFLTDSELVAQTWPSSEPMTVLPIPHLETCIDNPKLDLKKNGQILCWLGKADSYKYEFLRYLDLHDVLGKNKLSFAIQDSQQSSTRFLSLDVSILPNGLSRQEYMSWLDASDILLYPHPAMLYLNSTSGVFVEMVAMKKRCLASAGTWMAHELAQYGLEDLIVTNWKMPDITQILLHAATDPILAEKLETMSKQYQLIHGEKAYAQKILELWTRTSA
ncbi:MAG: hypothetical protein HQM12_06695 [SAR324 cluster bacterium]|nr:hypothetical protein [SAR324 cluster bacterium]